MASPRGVVVGVDIGGTFTDAVVLDPTTGTLTVAKALTTPSAPSEGMLNALDLTGAEPTSIARLFHGTTLGLNTALERSGALVGLIMSEGCRDVLEIGRMNWPMYRMYVDQAPPLVPRYLRVEVPERVTADGALISDFTDEDVIGAVHTLLDEGAALIAVSFMHAYGFPANERRVAEIIRRTFPELDVILSHEVANEYREYERTVTTVVEATIKPKLGRYFKDLGRQLTDHGFRGELFITRSDGGVMNVAAAANSCVQTLVSGPASGIAGAADLGRRLGVGELLTIDVGGTSFDAALIRDGQPILQPMTEIDGLPRLLMPSIELATIGAGGGSIAFIDQTGGLEVGPRSAGSTPGPICYGRGGTEPTFTDAALVSGILDPAAFMGGRMSLDRSAAEAGIRTAIAEPLGLTVEDAASGIVALVEAKMGHKLEEITIGRGLDPRDFVMVAYGGGGPMVADALATRIGVEEIVIPRSPGTFSARGMLTLDVVYTFSRTTVRDLDAQGVEQVGPLLRRRLAWSEVTKLTFNPVNNWFFLTGPGGMTIYFGEGLDGIGTFAEYALRLLPPKVLEASPEAEEALQELAGS
jgi:N-methylhydantoinase A